MHKIKWLLNKIGMEQRALAKYLGLHEMTVWRWINEPEKHKPSNPNRIKLIQLAESHGIKMYHDDFF